MFNSSGRTNDVSESIHQFQIKFKDAFTILNTLCKSIGFSKGIPMLFLKIGGCL